MRKGTLIVVVGPTAIGKTKLAIDIAQNFDAEIISSDSRQFYQEMEIGTAVPSQEELAAIKHHFIQHISIVKDYSVGDFEREALEFMQEYFEEKEILVMVGGSGLYEKAVTQGLDNFPEIPAEIRTRLNQELSRFGLEKLQKELAEKDSMYFSKIDENNPQRVIRALEIIRGSGKTYSSFLNQKKKARDFDVIKIGLTAEREMIYERINQRVDVMMKNGLLEEVKKLYGFKALNALQTVGYRELFAYFEGEYDLNFAIEEIKKNTRRFAKRQLTWYRKDNLVQWFDFRNKELVINYLNKKMQF
ncbi:tRNA dimethylallyltransferase [Candidatus Ornithobacterium hominis]|uniref:tRNA dimethylallyltransferase n=1 Tax=Candidatus Ornithobacterium hominis TaxID=2497989 RepID=A0A383U3Y2_9FLAO|nr:tRNA (adenosine(37)-N6)-dimethylallyltransferase MiaA [Candidatus Ornithobacterium hominis]MCT7905064.1 tRNA (adenosine(37)-N6)-dimethylallyltransferase MiaA [Candidatus Ornithobacterium hominis]SZD74099.1 tRNA dimethylallyltransferase [Candidatus Ornithobacterium hominis]